MTGHLVDLHDNWRLWRWALVRAAGFPARRVLELGDPTLAEAADRLATVTRQVAAARTQAITELERAFPAKEPQGKAAGKLIKKLRRGELPLAEDELATSTPALIALQELAPGLQRQREQYDAAYVATNHQASTALRSWVQDDRFREAIAWQNRRALATGIDRVLATPVGSTNSKDRQHEYLVASYVQRYCVKNDTIGFFGPLSWGAVTSTPGVEVRPGPGLLAERAVYFEHWATDLIAQAFSAAPDVKPLLAPRLLASVRVDGNMLSFGHDKAKAMAPVVARVLAACDGKTPARDIAAALLADGEIDTAEDLYELLDESVGRRLISWSLEPSALVHPEHELRVRLMELPDCDARTRMLQQLDRLEAARDEVVAAAGDSKRIEQTLEAFEATFAEITGQAASRRAGETYAARTPLYEDCVRDLELSIGRSVTAELGPAFTLIAQSARWFTYELAQRFRQQLIATFRGSDDATGGRKPFLRFWREAQNLFPVRRGEPGVVSELGDELDRRWASILQLDMTAHAATLTTAALRDAVATTFDAPGAGWPAARHVCPDVLIAAGSVDAISRGDFLLVLGEVHIGSTVLSRFLVPHGPDRDDSLMRACEADLAEPRVLPVEAREHITRADSIVWSARDYDLEIGASKSWRAREQVLRAADLVVDDCGHTLVVRDVARDLSFDVIALLEGYLTYLAQNYFRPAPRGEHVPRVTIDRVVLCREQWRFTANTLPFIASERGAQQLLDVRAWATSHEMPRYVFAKVPEEPKPIFVDFASPLLVEMFAKIVRKASTLTVTEMLPTAEQCWVPDHAGNTYSSELRLVAVDPLPWARPRTT